MPNGHNMRNGFALSCTPVHVRLLYARSYHVARFGVVSLSRLCGFTPYFGDVWSGLVSPVLLYRGDTHGYTVSASHADRPPPPCLPCTCRTATSCCGAP